MYSKIVVVVLCVSIVILWFSIINLIDYRLPEFIGEVCSDEIKKAMKKMGPRYDYMMKGEKLYVNRGDGKWLELRYERR